MTRDYHEARCTRLPIARALFLLGISMKWIADALSVTATTLMKDLASVGLTRGGERLDQKVVYANVFRRYAQIFASNPSIEDALVFKHLVNWLRVNDVMNVIFGLELAMRRMHVPEYSAELENHALLVRALCGNTWSEYYVRSRATFWQDYLFAVSKGSVQAPTSHNDLLADLARCYVRFRRDHVMPIWPANVAPMFDKLLATLTAREERVMRMRFGIGNKQQGIENKRHTIAEVGQDFGLTPQRILQIEAKAMRKLRHPSRMKWIAGLAEPLTPNYYVPDVSVEVRKTPSGEAPKAQFSVQDLVRPVRELEFSVRTAACLYYAKIEWVWQLAEKTEVQLLRCKNFGRKSLKEVREVLEGMNLHLGMNFSEDTKRAMFLAKP